jgi:PAS domain S-box-containing protein
VLVCGFEVTAQVRAAQELTRLLSNAETAERQFRELVENLPELAWTARADGFVDYYNHRWYEYTGTTYEQVQGWGWQSLHDPAMIDRVVAHWQRSIETGEPFEMEYPLRGADGKFRWFLTRVRPFHDAEGHIVRWFGSNTDIDDRRRNDDFRETFLGILGHDLRNPLSTILVTAQVLKLRTQNHPELREYVERVSRSGTRMQRMIEQLLDLTRARLTAGISVTMSPQEIDLARLVARIVDEIRAAHPQSLIDFEVNGECNARVDTDRFEQVVSNLVENAVTHGDPAKPVRLVLTGEPNVLRMTVQNFGVPISPDFLPLVFSPFARGGETGQHSSAGLGLGLYICERIIYAHHGKLSVRSSQEAGTCFEVLLPRLSA